jgi:competence protein ComEC
MCYEENCFLFTGDISSGEEDGLDNKDIASDILKIAHHGSKYSSSGPFLDAVNPRLAIIQVGKNNYGHPDKGVLDRLSDEGIRVMRTDDSGNIEIYSDGKDYKVITER